MKIKVSQRLSPKRVKELQRRMRREGIGRLVVKVDGEEDMVLEIARKDADGRSLLED